MSGDFKNRHHEVHRTKLYIADETTFSIPMQCVDVMRHTRARIDNASEHTLNDHWNDDRKVSLSEEWNKPFPNTKERSTQTSPKYYTTWSDKQTRGDGSLGRRKDQIARSG